MNTNKMMRILFLMLLSVSIFIVPSQRLFAQQTYPVQIQPAVSFPSTMLNDYGDPANTSIRVYLADLTKNNYTINIRIKLTSTKLSYTSIHGINITMDGGQVYFLNANELSRLFALTDLTIDATTKSDEPNSLPEGPYNLALQAFDVSLFPTLVPVSNVLSDFTIFNVVRYDPPLLNSPTNKQEFDLQTTNQNIFFNWTPRHIVYSPSQHIQYRYRMIRVLPVDRNPYDAVNTSVAGATGNIDVNALDFATFIYSPSDLQLEPGGVYAWQVQAYEMINGIVSTSRFKNQGLSEVFTFSIKENCGQITLAPPVVSASSVTFNWNKDPNSVYNEYEFNYRAVGSSTGWIPISTVQNTITLTNAVLQTGIPYEYNVRARCNNWLTPVQGSTFTLATPTCVAPTPITVNTSGTATVLSWTAAQNVDSLKLYYKITGSADPYSTILLNPGDVQCSLPKLTSGGYTIHLDALCGTSQTAGATNDFAYNDNGIVGPCPIPLPFQLIASRITGKVDMANLNWNTVTGAHTGSSITYWHKDSSTVTYSLNASIANAGAGVSGSHIYDDQLYNYNITYLCGTKNVTTPIGMFRILSAAAKVNIDPPTASCFPPVDIRAEARDSVTARVEWDKISGADNYELSYRVKGTTTPFITFNTTATNATLKPLQENAQYQLLVRVKCSGVFSIYSDTALVDLSIGRNRNCDTVVFFKALKKTINNIQTAWNFDSTCTGYIIKYREEAQPLASEYTQAFTNIDSLKHNNVVLDTVRYTFQNLKSGTKYIFRIQKICGQNNALFNLPLAASTLPDAKSSGGCGSGNVCNKDSTSKLQSLKVKDTIYCADYIVLVDSITTGTSNPSMGIYSGLGHMDMPVPGLGDFVSMHVSFKNVKINAKPNSCVYGGTINIDSMNASIIPTKIRDSVKALMAKAEGLIDEANAALAQAQGLIDKLQAGLQQGIDYFQGGDGVGNVVTGELGDKEIATNISSSSPVTVNGTEVTVNGVKKDVGTLPALLKDTEGEVYQVTSTGLLTYVGKYDTTFAKDTTLDISAQVVTYTEYTGAIYDFDQREAAYSVSEQIDREYEKIGASYYVAAKFITPGVLDKVTATLSGSGADPSKVVFSNGKGFVYDKGTNPGNTFTLNLAGGPASDGQYIYAWYVDGGKKKAIGKLLLPSYATQTKNVVLIPVKGAQTYNAATYETYLNQTYQKIGITYHVTVDNSFKTNTSWATGTNLTIQSSGSNLLSNDYQGKERDIIKAYVAFKGAANIDPNTAYFIAVYEPTQIESKLLGKMPAEEQFGFLYSGNFPNNGSAQDDGLKRTMAHELGHGAYHMEHIFNAIYLGVGRDSVNVKSSLNLMSYYNTQSANELWKFQWDIIQDPGHVWGILKRDRDAQMASISNIEVLYANFKNDDGSLTFLTPSGKPITIKEKLKQVNFVTGDYWYKINSDGSRTITDDPIPYGTLASFTLESGDTEYHSRVDLTSKIFEGYVKANSTDYYKESLSYTKKYTYVITGVPCLKSGRFIYNIFHTNFLEATSSATILADVKESNQGEGLCQPELFLQNYLSNANDGKEVYAVISGSETFEKVFLDTRLDSRGDVCGKEAIFAFKCAMVLFDDGLGETEGLYNCLDEAEDAVVQSLHNGYSEMVGNSYVPRPVPAVSTSVYNAALDQANQASGDKFAKDNFFEHLLPILVDLSNILIYHQPAESLADTDIDDIVDFFIIKDANGETNIAGRMCLLSSLDINIRKKIIKRINSNTWSDEKEKLMVDIISTTPNDQGLLMLTFLAENNYEWFEKIYDEIHLSHRDQFVYSISYMALNHWDRKNIAQAMPPDYDAASSIFNNSTDYVYACGNEILDCDTKVFGVDREVSGINYSLLGDINPLANYQVKFAYSLGEGWEKDFVCKADPFEFIKVSFVSDFNFPLITSPTGKTIKTNEIVEVPAFWLYYILREKTIIENVYVVRIIADVAAVGAAVLTAEPGPVLIAEALFAGVDAGVATYVEKLSDHDPFAESLNDSWNTISLGVGAVFITKTVVGSVTKFALDPQKLTAYIGTLRSRNIPSEIDAYLSQTSALLINLAKFSTQYGIDKVRNIFYSTMLSAYIEVKALTYTKNLNTSLTQLVKNGNQLVLRNANNVEIQIASLTEIENTGSLSLTSTRWLPENTPAASITTVGKVENITYTYPNQLSKVGDLEYVTVGAGQLYIRVAVSSSNKLFTVNELQVLKRADLPDFVRNNLDDLLSDANRNVIWSLTDETAGQFKRGDLIEEIFNQWSSKYKNYQNLNEVIPNYKTLDFDGVLNNTNEVVSLKTYQPTSATEKTLVSINAKLDNYTSKLSTATLDPSHAGKTRVLDFTIKKGEWDSFMDDILDHVDDLQQTYPNVTIRITEF
ncbi:hypothetical protein [Cytophaga aurantiaca]|uniref:hypothetical protein n=1 Tax=Cytophaga aurantiaca TaxID=29530 RepID=UPI00035F08A4|nr:hypothetical protein [Cytophaga aurantiaca]